MLRGLFFYKIYNSLLRKKRMSIFFFVFNHILKSTMKLGTGVEK